MLWDMKIKFNYKNNNNNFILYKKVKIIMYSINKILKTN